MARTEQALLSRRQVEIRVLLVAVVVSGLAALWSLRLGDLGVFLPEYELPAWTLLVPFAAAELLLVRLRIGNKVDAFTLSSVPLVVGFFVVEPVPLVAMHVAGVAIALARERVRPAIGFYNLAMAAFDSAVALSVFRALADPADPFGLRTWVAVIVAALAGLALDTFFLGVAAWCRGEDPRTRFGQAILYTIAAEVVNATFAFLALRLLTVDLRTAWLLGGLGLFVVLAYRNYSRLLNAHESLDRLYSSTQEIERARDHRASIQSLLDQTLELLGADTAELTFLPTDTDPALVVVSGRDRLFEEIDPEVAARMAAERAAELEGADDDGLFVTDRDVAEFDESAAAQLRRQILTAPLKGPSGTVGTIRVSMNWGDAFTDADRQLLEMFANHASVALHNSRLIEQLRAEVAQREHQAMHDGLTALPNRVMFDLQTRHALDRRGDDELVAVMLVDLDRFKEVNDTLGHGHGDELLEILADRIGLLAEDGRVTVARLGGDEFALLVQELDGEDELGRLAAQVRSIIETPVEIAGVLIDVGASLGLAVAPHDGDDAQTLLQKADVAMYVAKEGHQGVVRYEPGADPYSAQRLSLAADLRHAVESGGLDVHFQPVIALDSGSPIAVEALARWTHPDQGVVPPDVFIPIAERSGLIRDLTFVVLRRSLEALRRWHEQGHPLSVGVNLSVRCLGDDELVAKIARHLHDAGVDPAALKLEVTEGTIMADPVRAIAVLEDLDALGVSLSIDDFGMGFSSLNQLKRLPVGQLKIDRSFVSNLPDDRDDAVIVRSVIELGHNLGMEVVAEGVEGVRAVEYLRSLGCDAVQGYYYSPALPEAELDRWLRRHGRRSADRAAAR